MVLSKTKKEYYARIISETTLYKGISFNDYIKFHLGLNKNIPLFSLQLQALAYIDIFDIIFNKEQPDCLISIGDSRLCIEVGIAIAKQKNVKVYYIEQGPFNTTFFDDVGVNANLSIRNQTDFESILDINFKIDLKAKSKTYKRSPIYRGLDLLLMSLFELHNLYPPDLKHTDLNSARFKKMKPAENEILKKPHASIILLVLQVPLDVNMIYHSPIFKSHTDIIKSVYANLPKNATLMVREHPLYINKYERSFYDFVNENGVRIENATPLNKAIELAEVVVVTNSTVGIEAILKHKTTVVLGNAFYDDIKICLKLKTKDELEMLLEKALTYRPNEKAINHFKHLLFSTVLLEGSITDKDLKSSKRIANHLLSHH